jgi:hypothetical protein
MIVDNKRQPAALPSSVSPNSESLTSVPLNSVSRPLRSVFARTNASFMRTTEALMRTNAPFMSTNASFVHTNASKPLVSQLTRPLSSTPFESTSDAFMRTNASLLLASHLIEPQSLLCCRPCQHQLSQTESIKNKIRQHKESQFRPDSLARPQPTLLRPHPDRPGPYPLAPVPPIVVDVVNTSEVPRNQIQAKSVDSKKHKFRRRTGFCVRSTRLPRRPVPRPPGRPVPHESSMHLANQMRWSPTSPDQIGKSNVTPAS